MLEFNIGEGNSEAILEALLTYSVSLTALCVVIYVGLYMWCCLEGMFVYDGNLP